MLALLRSFRQSVFPAAAFFGVVLLTIWVYWPGLTGDFLLDDEPHLRRLADLGHSLTPTAVLAFALEGSGGRLGRPLSYLSFLLNDTSWPSPVESFKYTGILIHVLNGVLICWLSLKLMRTLGSRETTSQWVAIAVGALWLLHPLNVSTALYVIQRMTQLAALFVIAGLIAYHHGRLGDGLSDLRRLIWMSAGIGLGTVLAVLCKESGALLPLYALVLELTVLQSHNYRPRFWRAWKTLFLWLPVAVIGAWHVGNWSQIIAGYRHRPFSLSERLFTEAQVLVDYLRHILLPHRQGTGLAHDDVLISTGVFDPPTTLLALAIIAALLVTAIWLRRRTTVYSFAVFWFFGGHALESGVLPLEIYFEHRNYLPMVGPLFALTYYVLTTTSRTRAVLKTGFVLYLGLATLNTWQNTLIWGDPPKLAATWEREHPDSARALQYAATFWLRVGDFRQVHARLDRLSALRPDAAGPLLQKVWVDCLRGSPPEATVLASLVANSDRMQYDHSVVPTFRLLINRSLRKGCPGIEYGELATMVEMLLANPGFHRGEVMANLYSLRGRMEDSQGDTRAAATSLREAYRWNPDYRTAVIESHRWAITGDFDQALEAVARAKQVAGPWIVAEARREDLRPWEEHLRSRVRRETDF